MSSEASLEHNYGQQLAKPLHIQSLERSLSIAPLLTYVENLLTDPIGESDGTDTDAECDILKPCLRDGEDSKILNGITITKDERRADKTRLYNFGKVKKSRKWLKNILLSDTSSDEEDEKPISQEELQSMLKFHKFQKKHQMHFYQDAGLHQYQYYSTGMLSNYDKYPEHFKAVAGPRKKISREQKKMEKKVKAKLKKLKKEKDHDNGDLESLGEIDPAILEMLMHQSRMAKRSGKQKKLTPEQADIKRKRIWMSIAKKEIPKAQKQKASARKEMLTLLKKVSTQCMKECRRAAIQSQKVMKETPSRARRITREMLVYWKRFDKVEKEHRRKAEKEALEQRKMDLELREARRQQRKLNFLITQTELYAHFMARKLTGDSEEKKQKILSQLEDREMGIKQVGGYNGIDDDYDSDEMKKLALTNAEQAYQTHQAKTCSFDDRLSKSNGNMLLDSSLANPVLDSKEERPQPSIFQGKLKGYQLKGMNWLANLYNQGINGILADEMGLGKTVQSIAFLAHLAEFQSIWGPFLVIAPASTLHNWQQECARFVSKFKVVPYWGNAQDRRILRKFWDQRSLHTEDASFHVVITSYQLVIQDVKYFQRIKWQYMILDEAQALKSSSSVRWKILLGFNCRNRLLLTGTPIQNSMAELWALLHFIMPTLFDSHDEFNEWFSKDIESHAEKQSGIDADQLGRLHMILKPFMLRRVKKDVENELSDKIEILVYCPLTSRQRLLYQAVKNKISIEDLLNSTYSNTSQAQSTTSSLMNLVMQFRKVCNHPDLFERREPKSPFYMDLDPYYVPKLIYREGILESAQPSKAKLLYNLLYIFSSEHIHRSLFPQSHSSSHVDSCFSFLRFINMSPEELQAHMGGLLVRWLAVFLWLKEAYRIYHINQWKQENNCRQPSNKLFLLQPCEVTSFPNLTSSPNLKQLVFASHTACVVSHESHVLHYIPETTSHRQIRLRHLRLAAALQKRHHSPPQSPTKSPKGSPGYEEISLPIHRHKVRPSRVLKCQPTSIPGFLFNTIPKARSGSIQWYTIDRNAAWQKMKEELCGTLDARRSLLFGTPEKYMDVRWQGLSFFPPSPGGLSGTQPRHGFSAVYIPDKESLVSDAGKLTVLDSLLQRLKNEGHRVLIYSQMTRMIDLLEEYMWYRKHTYMRLDGSSKISERRDMVADFQARSDIFVFLLSTRAGGLGINLTAADTVIFYDSDWNPTVDQQAMDRAHRLGQTKQVTVYRLICKGTIEERILQRAKEKSEIQRMVIQGGNFRPDTLKPKEVVSLLIDDDEMEKKLKVRQEERKSRDGLTKEERKRKREYKKREGKKSKLDDSNMTIPAPDTESVASLDSMSVPASPQSVMSVGSEAFYAATHEDSSNDGGLVIVDDAHSNYPPVSSTPTPKSKRGRGRGRPRGSGIGRRPRGRGTKKALSAAEIAGAQAGMNAAYAALGYNVSGIGSTGSPRTTGSLPTSGRSTPTV